LTSGRECFGFEREDKKVAITISTVYDLGTTRFVYVQMHATTEGGGETPLPIRIRADKFERAGDSHKMILKIGDQQVGEFNSHSIAGWWIEDVDDSAPLG
jgi:hypothetical protein